MSVEKRRELVMDLLPQDIKNEICLETVPTEVDTTPKKVVLKKCVVSRSNKHNPTPQDLLDDAVYFLKQGKGYLASESAWGSACLQLKYFLMQCKVDADCHDLKKEIIGFLLPYFTDEVLQRWFFLHGMI
uniref:Mab-21 domain-containing protein n=1 Tax=Meloidogyne hapla TaxID=6305 RepID=A0A1I8BIK5_MELHA